MTEKGGDDLERDALVEQEGGGGMAAGVEAPAANPSAFGDPVPPVQGVGGVGTDAELGGEDDVGVGPQFS